MRLGAVFTQPSWARWGLGRLDAPARVAAGATLCDPTAGEGVFAHALAELWSEAGHFERAWVRRITLVEREGSSLEAFARSWRERWGFAFPEANLIETDVVTAPPAQQFDLLVGNPPWITYPDLDPETQNLYRPWFSALGLVGGPSSLLLGASRLDLAALVTARAFTSLSAPGGRWGFFLPLSLFHNEGPRLWRRWQPDAVFDLTDCRPFPGVATRCGWAEFTQGTAPRTTVAYYPDGPHGAAARAVCEAAGDPWRVGEPGSALPQITLRPSQRPRQGINTGGCNAAFHVSAPPAGVDSRCVFPLAGKPGRFVLVPYHRSGKIFAEQDLEGSGLARYWEAWKERLANRKGVLLGSQLRKGHWWALLGVGEYAFAPFKVIWSAYGRHRLDAQVWGPRDPMWQADQALQAYIPCRDEGDALRIAEFLNSPQVANFLESSRSAGTRSWAQPGRFKPLWRWQPEDDTPARTIEG